MIKNLYLAKYSLDKIPPDVLLELIEFCQEAEKEGLPPSVNMSVTNWKSKPETLFYKLFQSKEYEQIFLAYKHNELIGVSACYKLNKKVMVCGCRCWTVPEYRTKYVHGNHLFPLQFKYAKKQKCSAAWFTFNDYNEWLYKFLKRISDGKATAFGMKNSKTYMDLKFMPGAMLVKGTSQYVAIKKL